MSDLSGNDLYILPRRLMDPKKAQELIAIIKEMKEVINVEIVKMSYSGGGYVVGRFILSLKGDADADKIMAQLKPILDQMMPYGYDADRGVFIKPRKTVKDYLRETGRKSGL
jgi:methyl coenzyme M reductase subunit D